MKRREDFKRFVVFCLASLVVIAQTAVFAYIWYDFYRGLIFEPFWRKGNWVLIAIYALINVLFSRLYGGTEGWLSEEDRCILFDDDRNDLYEYFYVFPDYTDQPLVLGSAADG